jgi:hypothetical protein
MKTMKIIGQISAIGCIKWNKYQSFAFLAADVAQYKALRQYKNRFGGLLTKQADRLYLVFSRMFFFQSFVNIIKCSTKWAGCFHFD